MSRFDPIDAFDHGDTCDLDTLLHPSQAPTGPQTSSMIPTCR
jgi:hypothetical protein